MRGLANWAERRYQRYYILVGKGGQFLPEIFCFFLQKKPSTVRDPPPLHPRTNFPFSPCPGSHGKLVRPNFKDRIISDLNKCQENTNLLPELQIFFLNLRTYRLPASRHQ